MTYAAPAATGTQPTPPKARAGLLDEALRCALGIGLVLVLLWPPARGWSEALGWMPLWLLGMPASALWALRGCPFARRACDVKASERRRRRVPQARRRTRTLPRRVASRAA